MAGIFGDRLIFKPSRFLNNPAVLFYVLISNALFLIRGSLMAQDTLPGVQFRMEAYFELYYSYDFSNPQNHERPDFLYSYKRHNEVNLNLGYIKASLNGADYRANLGFMAGNYAQYNLADEPALLQQLYEANAGIRINKKRQLWLDAGVFPSHLGFESVVGKDGWTLTRAMCADNSPYYESGLRISTEPLNSKWYAALYYLNGWQHMQRPDGNNTPAFGSQISFRPDPDWLLNWSTFAGNDFPDSLRRWRYFSNLYAIGQISPKLGITVGFDLGAQQAATYSTNYQLWYTPILLLRCTTGKNSVIVFGAEYYDDRHEVLVNTMTAGGFQNWGYSINYDLKIGNYFLCRVEARMFNSKDEIFTRNNLPAKTNFCLSSSFCVSLK